MLRFNDLTTLWRHEGVPVRVPGSGEEGKLAPIVGYWRQSFDRWPLGKYLVIQIGPSRHFPLTPEDLESATLAIEQIQLSIKQLSRYVPWEEVGKPEDLLCYGLRVHRVEENLARNAFIISEYCIAPTLEQYETLFDLESFEPA